LFLFRLFFSPGRLLLLATLAVAGYLLVSAGTNFLHTYRLAGDEAELRQQVEALLEEKAQLQQIRDYLRSDEYIEFMSRRVFGLVKQGESMVVVDAPPESRAGDDAGLKWWQRLFGR
jgi:cell division protein FtsB